MATPASNFWNALVIHISEGGSNLLQLLEQQGYELIEQWEGPTAWRSLSQDLMQLAFLDLTQASQSSTVLFLQTIGQLHSPVVVVSEAAVAPAPASSDPLLTATTLPAVSGSPRSERGFLLRKQQQSQEPAAPEGLGARSAPDEMEDRLLQELKVQSSINMVSGIAHDANNFLTVVSTCAALLSHEPLSPLARGYLDDLRTASDRAASLLRQLSNLCRPQASVPCMFDLNQLIESLSRLIGRLLGEEIEVVLDLERHPCLIYTEPAQMEQVLLNLAVNARDAMPRQGLFCLSTTTLHVATTTDWPLRGLRPGPYVTLAVTDTGCGMTESVRARIFEPFFTTKDPSQGTGIGLATVDRFVRQIGGQIEVESAPGRGTTFRIYLPQASGAALADAS